MDKGEKLNKNHKHEDLKNEVKDKVFGHLLTAFGLVVGLAWNDAIATFIAEFFRYLEILYLLSLFTP